jgi:hypothetical protein
VSHAPYYTPASGIRAGWSATISGPSSIASAIQFQPTAKCFSLPNFSNNAKSYFYYQITENELTPATDNEFKFILKSGNIDIPSGGKYMGNNIMQFWVDLSGKPAINSLNVAFPDILTASGQTISLISKPPVFDIQVINNPVEQNIDVFAGLSLGANLILGGVEVVATVSAASFSVNGTAGMGMNFMRDSEGNQFITRRVELGVGAKLEAPKIDVVLGKVDVGVEASLMTNFTGGQTMKFPLGLNSDLIKKAKATYILETLSIGGIEMSPFTMALLKALQVSLLKLNPDLSLIYRNLYYQSQVGLSLEGKSSLGFSYSFGEGENVPELNILDLGRSFTFSADRIKNKQDNSSSISFAYAKDFDVSILSPKLPILPTEKNNLELSSLFNFNFGGQISLDANFNNTGGFESLNLGFGAYPSAKISLLNYSETLTYNFNIPRAIFIKNQNSENICGSIAPMCTAGLSRKKLRFGANYFADNVAEIFKSNPDEIDFFSDHILIEKTRSSIKGIQLEPKFNLSGAVGVGGGISVGLLFSTMNEMSQPKTQHTIAKGKLLPLAEYQSFKDEPRLFDLSNELVDLFSGTSLLVKDALKQVINSVEIAIDNTKEFIVETVDGAGKVWGTIKDNSRKLIIRVFDPSSSTQLKIAFMEPKVVQAYVSHRVIHLENKKAVIDDEPENSALYIVSQNYNINLYDENDSIVETFDPIYLAIAIDQKKMAKMYFYDDQKLLWIELAGNLNNHPDTIATEITRSGNYALGIEVRSSDDKTAPEIQDYYPKINLELIPENKIWAKLVESPTGVGIDFSKTMIKIDGDEALAQWNPVDKILSYTANDSLSSGIHQFSIVAVDYNGNSSEVFGAFSYKNTTYFPQVSNNSVEVICYPNPVIDYLHLKINTTNSDICDVCIYNELGQPISSIFEHHPENGSNVIKWDRIDLNGQRVKSGVYFVRVKIGEKIVVQKIILY